MVNNKNKNKNYNNSSNSLVFGRWPQTTMKLCNIGRGRETARKLMLLLAWVQISMLLRGKWALLSQSPQLLRRVSVLGRVPPRSPSSEAHTNEFTLI